ncbi:hypothetical protein [Streptomyces sp. NPDC055105]|uniref:hypothetical protein n=1 Tax=Streptomyces sp. NPDC055105 TaxID=3365719 RepID=UPI0037D5A6D5
MAQGQDLGASVAPSLAGSSRNPVEVALGKHMLALLVHLGAACTAADDFAEAVEEAFPHQHPDAEVLLSFPGPRHPTRRLDPG